MCVRHSLFRFSALPFFIRISLLFAYACFAVSHHKMFRFAKQQQSKTNMKTQISPFVMRFTSKKKPYQIISIQMNFTNRSKCGSGDVTKELRFIYWESISTHIFICSFWTWKSSQRLKQNIKLLDIDRKFYNRQCNPFDIAKRKRRKFHFASNTID